MIFNGELEQRAEFNSYDYIIVGSGAGGATAARVLADTGLSVAVVEEGPAVEQKEFGDQVFPALRRMFRNMGAQVARGRALIPIVQGSCLGGSTVINSAIVWRIPEDVWTPWRDERGLGQALPLEALSTHWERIESELNIHPVERPVWGNHNRLMHEAREKLGLSGHPIRRGDRGCRGSARCLTGCPHGAKQSMLVSYLPYAAERGATFYTSARVDKVEVKGGKARAVVGHFRQTPLGKKIAPFRLEARRAVLVAASVIQTPEILRRSGIKNPHLGRHFMGHPGTPLMGIFDRPIHMWQGATQGYDLDHYRRSHRFKIETISLPPEMAFTRLPGVGARWKEAMGLMDHAVIWAVQLRSYAEGRVREYFFGPDVSYDLTREDMVNLRKGLRVTAELLFAAGAREVWPGVFGLPERLTHVDQVKLLEEGPEDPGCYSFIVSHLFGTTRMAAQPRDGVVSPNFSVFGVPNLFVVDASIFPTNLGVNPQHAIMGLAWHGAERVAEQTS